MHIVGKFRLMNARARRPVNDSRENVLDAREKLNGIINPTPLQYSQTFSRMTGSQIRLKPECLQKNGSFKIRGAYTMLNRMSTEEQKRGIVTFSAGNWA